MAEIIHQPHPQHHCHPGWRNMPLPDGHPMREHGHSTMAATDPATRNAPTGTLWRCDCGLVWRARPAVPGTCYAHWGPESPLAHWLRRRRERRGRSHG
jgi:hypothetical protein